MEEKYTTYNAYKGLQKPLIFKGFKGKFIYIGFGIIVGALLLCVVISTLFTFMYGGMTLIVVLFGGLGLIAKKQKRGLNSKDNRKGYFIVSNTFN